MPRGSMVPEIPARETRSKTVEAMYGHERRATPHPSPGICTRSTLPTSSIDDELLAPTAVSRERSAQNARRRSRWAIHAQIGDEHLAELAVCTRPARAHQERPRRARPGPSRGARKGAHPTGSKTPGGAGTHTRGRSIEGQKITTTVRLKSRADSPFVPAYSMRGQ